MNTQAGFTRFLVLIIVIVAVLFLGKRWYFPDENIGSMIVGVSSAEQVAGIKKMQTAMEIFNVENGLYPTIAETCAPAAVLKRHLVPNYVESLPEGHASIYQASVAGNGNEYVLRTKLSTSDTTLLANDVDGIVLNCDCDDPFYCVTEGMENSRRVPVFDEI